MFNRFISLILILGCMALITHADPFGLPEHVSATLVLGFMLLGAYCVGFLLERLGLPRITGYILAGLFMGPFFLKFYNQEAVSDLDFLNNLALAFIAFCAGGELKLSSLRRKLKSIVFLIAGVTSVVFVGVTLTVLALSGFIPFMAELEPVPRLAVSALFGVIAVARSPSSAIAVICETRARGDYTDTVLGVTIVMDVVIIIFFAVVVSICEVTLSPAASISVTFALYLLLEIGLALVLGFLLGKGIIFLIQKVKVEFPVVIAAMGFLVIKFCHLLGEYLQEVLEIGLDLEPLLICMAAGFSVQNFSKHGTAFLTRMDSVSYPIFIGFFTITGANINIDVLKTGWFLGLLIAASRTLMIFIGSYFSGRLAGDEPRIYKNTWLGFITQAGVSLGLLSELARRFPYMGIPIQTILIATITLNQVIGPVAFKRALHTVKETHTKTG